MVHLLYVQPNGPWRPGERHQQARKGRRLGGNSSPRGLCTDTDFEMINLYTNTFTDVINVGSYNYLGFAHAEGPCSDRAAAFVDQYGLGTGFSRNSFPNFDAQRTLEATVARFLGTEDAVVCPMGFGTNVMNLPAIINENTLVLSDKLNHASLVLGLRMSKAKVAVFEHNDAKSCEKVLLKAFADFKAAKGRPPAKVLIVVEGIYSMEGTILDLPSFIEVKKRYKAYLYIDEAHSIGALGPNGRGVIDYWGVDSSEVDILMGTLTKSFASAGGYIAGSKALINHLRHNSAVTVYGSPMSPVLIGQFLESAKIIAGEDGTTIGKDKIAKLHRNARYFRKRVHQLGFLVYGQEDSPVIPIMTFYTTKVVAAGREALAKGIGMISVGYPATALTRARARICMSADHTKDQLDVVLASLDEIGDQMRFKYGKNPYPDGYVVEY
uniref:Aminotran_1_2 domain-containing protein n=1 Tax=Panagrellus redivivus TaxID=6233 RepID=A0A7E4VMF6_PANRE